MVTTYSEQTTCTHCLSCVPTHFLILCHTSVLTPKTDRQELLPGWAYHTHTTTITPVTVSPLLHACLPLSRLLLPLSCLPGDFSVPMHTHKTYLHCEHACEPVSHKTGGWMSGWWADRHSSAYQSLPGGYSPINISNA